MKTNLQATRSSLHQHFAGHTDLAHAKTKIWVPKKAQNRRKCLTWARCVINTFSRMRGNFLRPCATNALYATCYGLMGTSVLLN